ncbi:MAG: DUF1906 domain-containing protein [Actinomycetota bacterium]|nr:DUF1906 domain-containing protein [Actinomycetota bacterium]
MRPSLQLSRRGRLRARRVGLVALVMVLAVVPSALARGGTRTLHYRGYALRAPVAWPAFDLTRSPETCVRFNRHAVYLGTPGARQSCPAHAAGRTEAILVRPLDAGAAAGAPGRITPGAGAIDSFAVPMSGVVVTATWSGRQALMSRLVHHRLRATAPSTRRPHSASPARAALGGRRGAATFHSAAVTYAGNGFDACTAPSTTAMNAWSVSPYRAVGVYIGGVNAACAQPNLNPSWVSGQVAAGWHLIPTYVGLQGTGACSGTCQSITPSQASAQGAAAANDAVNQARALGIPAGNAIYDDMEQYSSSSSMTVLGFLSAWTNQLHADGYQSGVYSSASSGISDLVSRYGTAYTEPDNIWIAHWDGQATTNDSYVPSGDWAGTNRIRQYVGGHNETYGGVTINIDTDYLNSTTANASPPSPFPDGTFVEASGDPNVYRVAGGAAMLVSNWSGFGGTQPVTMTTAAQLAALPPYPASGTFVTTTTGQAYRVAGGTTFPITNWSLFGGPQPSVTIDEWDLQNIGNALDHLLAVPANGTTVEGLPSGTFWTFSNGTRARAAATPGATSVEDQALSRYAISAVTGGVGQPRASAVRCLAPSLKHLSLVRTRSALRRAHCRIGTVTRPRRWGPHHLLRVFGQSVRPGSARASGTPINLRLL